MEPNVKAASVFRGSSGSSRRSRYSITELCHQCLVLNYECTECQQVCQSHNDARHRGANHPGLMNRAGRQSRAGIIGLVLYSNVLAQLAARSLAAPSCQRAALQPGATHAAELPQHGIHCADRPLRRSLRQPRRYRGM